MDFSIDRDSPFPIRDQLTGQIRLLIDGGGLAPGETLPTIKTTALALGVNPNTVAAAYRTLEEEGYLVQRKRAGTTVAESPPTRVEAVVAERLAAEAARRARAAGLEPADLLRAVAAQAVLAQSGRQIRVAVLAATELQARVLAARVEALLGDEVTCLPSTPDRYDSLECHLTIIEPQLSGRLTPATPATDRPAPTYLRYGPEFPAGAD